jgi:hypothetical protein
MDNLTIAFGQLLYWDTYDFHGVYDYLWATVGSTWYAFDAFTGDWVYTMTDVPSGNRVYGPKGEILIYNVNPSGGWMTLWNSTNIPVLHDNPTSGTMGWGQWRPYGKTVNATGATPVTTGNPLGLNGYQWNVTIPHGLPGGAQWVYPLDRVIGSSGPFSFPNPITPAVDEITSWGIDLTPGQEGELLFNEPWDTPDSWVAGNQTIVFEAVSPESEDGVFVLGARDNRQHYGFSTETGEYLWVTDPEIYLNWYGVGGIGGERPPLIAYDKMFTSGVGGIVYAYSTITGERLWTYEAEDQYKEFLFNNNWWMYPLFITDGKIYYGHLEHSPIDPRPRGGPFVVLDVDDGNVVWRADGLFRQNLWGGLAIIGDSIIATMDTYDQRIYAIGKGPTKTTIVASPKVSGLGGGVLIEGMVTDESPGTKDYGLMARFPNGVPVVADESMSDWMLYVYKQFPHPTDTAGVSVTLNAVDSEGNIISIDTVTTDDSGMFKKMWTPQEEGEYIIIATFMGTESYYTSYAQTAIGVGPALSPDGGIEPETPAPSISTEVAIIAAVVVIAVIGIAIYGLIKKRE